MNNIVILIVLLFLSACSACNKSDQGLENTDPNVFTSEFTTSNWVYTDQYGRSVAGYEESGARKKKLVGVFYFLWHEGNNPTQVNNTDFFKTNPGGVNQLVPGRTYYWGEPEDGYYSSKDPWIIRKHLRLLSLADVDFLYFDTTNGITFLDVVEVICKVAQDLRNEGMKVPQIVFTTNYNQASTIIELYDKFYRMGKYKEMWLMWEGKPIILAPKTAAPNKEIADFFTWRYGWSDWGNVRKDSWCWFNVGGYGYTGDNSLKAEQMVVSKGSHPTINVGSSYQLGPDGKIAGGNQPPINDYYSCVETGKGDMFEKQWEKVFQKDPDVVMITQWNEWLAVCCTQRYINEVWNSPDMLNQYFLGKKLGYDDRYFVDMFNDEYNRDIEPMKGGYGDVFYYRMVHYIRKFKGMDAPVPPSRPKTITIDGNFSEWMNVLPIYTDYKGDVKHRDFTVGGVRYMNNTGRNDIIQSRVARDDKSLYMYVSTERKMTPYTDKNWMLLFINIDRNKETGWEGYDFLVNSEVKNSETTTLKRWNGDSWDFIADIPYRVSGGEMELGIPLKLLGLTPTDVAFDFHWMDNMQTLDDINEFFINGDSAPERRFDYYYGK